MRQISGLLYSIQQAAFWPHLFLMIGWITAVYFVPVALIEIWKAENTFSIHSNLLLEQAFLGDVWACSSCLQRIVKSKMLISFLQIFIAAFKLLYWMLRPSHFGAFVPCGLLGSCSVFRLWGGTGNLLCNWHCYLEGKWDSPGRKTKMSCDFYFFIVNWSLLGFIFSVSCVRFVSD